MVCSVYKVKSSGAASAYYGQTDDYYRSEGYAPTAWAGRGAEALGLRGEVSTEQARALLEGRLPNGERVGGENHQPGQDITFSAPKSVSVAAYVHGDTRIIAVHEEAVKEAIRYLEREAACTRIRENNEVRVEATGNLVVAVYRHDTNRESECNLHSHAVTMNVTQSADGRWRSIESKPIYRLQVEAGQVYAATLSRGLERLGYGIEKTIAGKHTSFELADVSKAERDLFSTRSKQIEAELAKIGKTRETATAAEKQTATLATRAAKEEVDRGMLLDKWRDQHREAGFSVSVPAGKAIPESEYRQRADEAVKSAVAHLSERETRFTPRQIAAEARKIGMGKIDDRDIESAIARAAERGDLVARETRQFDVITGQKTEQAGYTTAEAMKIERQMLALANASVGAVKPAMTREQADEAIRAQETKPGAFAFNDAQRAATHAVLTGSDGITLIQGYAGSAKTTSVLAASADAFRSMGYEVVALAPTRDAATVLGKSIEAEGKTVASFLLKKPEESEKPRVYVLDEASMLSTRDMEKLLVRTQGSRLIHVGDFQQYGSVEAGAGQRQLQTDSMLKVNVLDVIVRQRNEQLKEAVYDAIRGDPHAALDKIEVSELATRAERVQALSRDYASLSREEREKTIVIAPGKDDRREINDGIRAELKSRGELGESRQFDVVSGVDMTKEEAKRAESYEVGYRLQAGRDYKSLGMEKGDHARVVDVDINKNRITIETGQGDRHEIDPAKYSKLIASEPRQMEIAVGDKLLNRDNTKNLQNGAVLSVEKVTDREIHARDENGKLHKLDMTEARQLDHAYAQTGQQSQGKTCDRVLIHGESTRVNLMSQQALYVMISRAKEFAKFYTDSREKLAKQIEKESGQKETALKSGDKPRQQDSKERPDGKRPGGDREQDKAGKDEAREKPEADKAGKEQPADREADKANPDKADKTRDPEDRQRERDAADERRPQPGDREPARQGEQPDRRTDEERRRDGELAAAALKTKGPMPQPAKINRDIEKGKAKWEYDSQGERYLVFRDKHDNIKQAYHRELHGRVREVGLRQAKTLGMTQKKAVIVDKHLKVFGINTGIKTGERVVVGRDTMNQKAFGRDRDELKDRMRSKETSGVGKLWAKAQDKLMSATNAEGWRKASTHEAIRAKLSAAIETRSMRSEARDKLEEKVKEAAKATDRGFER